MKTIIIIIITLILNSISLIAQKKEVSIIRTIDNINKYYEKSELIDMNKGQLVILYSERVKSLIGILPYIALTRKPGVSLSDLGIPLSSDEFKNLDKYKEDIIKFQLIIANFQKSIMPYADKEDIIISILYYEDILKMLNQID